MGEVENKKDESFWNILSAAIELDVKKGHLKWTLMDLSRKSKVTRSLIYYYFGKSKIEILKEATKLVGTEFTGFTEDRQKMWAEGNISEAIIQARRLCNRLPYIVQFTVLHRDSENDIGHIIRELEVRYKKKLQIMFPDFSEGQILAFWALVWGLSFAPMIDESVIESAIDFFKGQQAAGV